MLNSGTRPCWATMVGTEQVGLSLRLLGSVSGERNLTLVNSAEEAKLILLQELIMK